MKRALLVVLLLAAIFFAPIQSLALETDWPQEVTINPTITFSVDNDFVAFDGTNPIWGSKKTGGLSLVIQSNNAYSLGVCAEPLVSSENTLPTGQLKIKEAGRSNYMDLSEDVLILVWNKPNTGGAVYGIDFWIEGCIDRRLRYHCRLFFTASQL